MTVLTAPSDDLTVSRLQPPVPAARRQGYAQILASTAIIGGSSVANIGFGVIRTKAMALLLGPAGVGLMGVYTSIVDVTQSLAGMGIQSSGVRQIAEAMGSEDADRIARTAGVLKRVAVGLGIIGALLLLVLARPIAQLTFGTREPAAGVAVLALAVLFREIAAGQGALIQGTRRIADLARLNVLSALFGTLITIPMVYLWGTKGVVPSLVTLAAVSILTSTWYSRKVPLPRRPISLSDMRQETAGLLKVGFAFMATGFLSMGAGYAVKIIVFRHEGFAAAGLYQSAWALGGLYVTFILQAMGADFFPRLTAVVKDPDACNRMVNEQAHVSLLLAGPGVIATLTLAPVVIATLYSAEFYPAVTLLRWICLGMTLRVVAWPMGFIVVARGAQNIMIATEVAATLVHVGLAWLLVRTTGLDGAGAAFFGLYVWHGVLMYWIVRRVTGFRWSDENRRLGAIVLPAAGLVFCSFYVLPSWLALTTGLLTSALTGIYSVRTLMTHLSAEALPPILRTWLPRMGFMPAAPSASHGAD